MNNTFNNENNEITLEIGVLISDIWRGVKKFGWVTLVLAVLFSGIQFYRSYVGFVPMYTTTATFTVHTENKVLTGDKGIAAYSYYFDRSTADQLATVFPHIISNKILQRQVCNDLNVESMPATVKATCVQGTNMVTLTASGKDPQLTYDTLISVIENYPSVSDYIIGRTKLVIINEPEVADKPSNSGAWISSVGKAGLVGFVLGAVWIILYALLRKTIRTKDDIRTVLNQHSLGVLPQVVFKKYRREIDQSILVTNPLVGNDFLESLRLLRGSVHSVIKEGKNTVMITSTAPAEGKTVVAVNLASIFAKNEMKVLLVDADLRDSGIQKLLGKEKISKSKIEDNKYYRLDTIDDFGFSLLSFKSKAESVQKILRTDEIRRRLEGLKSEYDLILIDTPPCGIISDATIVAQEVDSIIYVIREDAVLQKTIRAGINSMLETDAEFLGCILNGAASGLGGYNGYYSYKGYYNNYRYGYSSYKYGYKGKTKRIEKKKDN